MEALEEEFDLNVSPSSESDSMESVEPPRTRSRRHDAGDENAMQLDPTNDPLYNLDEPEKVPTTADIQHFFERTPEGSVCTYCKYVLCSS
jgi:hypothetical protein